MFPKTIQSNFIFLHLAHRSAYSRQRLSQRIVQQKILDNIQATNEDVKMVALLREANKEEFSVAIAEQVR